jgi:DNA-binding MarR family transcriptional regulator
LFSGILLRIPKTNADQFEVSLFMSPKSSVSVSDSLIPSTPEAHLRVLRQFRSVFSSVRKHFQTMEKSAGIGGAPIWAMHLIAKQPGIGVTQLSQAMDVHQSTASNLVRGLVKAGYIISEKSAHDKRVVELYALPDGQKLLKKVPGPYSGVLPQALSELDAQTLLELERNLEALLQRMDIDERSAQTPMAMM